jgi:hypothetical protein
MVFDTEIFDFSTNTLTALEYLLPDRRIISLYFLDESSEILGAVKRERERERM